MAKTISSTECSSIYISQKKHEMVSKYLFCKNYLQGLNASIQESREVESHQRERKYDSHVLLLQKLHTGSPHGLFFFPRVTSSLLAKNDHLECLIILLLIKENKINSWS